MTIEQSDALSLADVLGGGGDLFDGGAGSSPPVVARPDLADAPTAPLALVQPAASSPILQTVGSSSSAPASPSTAAPAAIISSPVSPSTSSSSGASSLLSSAKSYAANLKTSVTNAVQSVSGSSSSATGSAWLMPVVILVAVVGGLVLLAKSGKIGSKRSVKLF